MKYYFLTGALIFILSSCCEPAQRNSFPKVITTSYRDTAIKDADQFAAVDSAANPLDSAFYPVYSIDIQNTGSQGDTFYLSYSRLRNGIQLPLTVHQLALPHSTITFKTFAPIPPNSPHPSPASPHSLSS